MLAQLFFNLNPLIPQTSNNKGMNEVASDKNCVPYPPGCKRPIARFACLHMTSSSALLSLSLPTSPDFLILEKIASKRERASERVIRAPSHLNASAVLYVATSAIDGAAVNRTALRARPFL